MHEEDHFRKRSWRAGPLTLTAPDPESIDSVLRWRNDPAVTEWLVQTIVDPASLKREWLDSLDNPLHHVLVARHGEDVVATGTLWIYDGQGQIHGDPNAYRNCEAGIDYLVDPRHQGRGFGGQVAQVMLHLAFDELGLRRVSAGCFADNRASRRILEKLGMRLEEYSVQASWHADRGWLDGCSYAILAEEWSSHRSD
ncbi:N-acetyltransferase [Brevibacterium permense]|uniref:GNAT family N-acetyltransferase n=1 Tax=Brevibacterium permense TaxID=234834 RepID=UPI0021D190A9|nr:GNAT family protein [Brevibacterium permense]MCU4295891.1 N-acetyltransferase [Brevibacterium permense]